MSFFGTVGLEKRKNILGNVFHHSGGKCRILQIRDVLCLYHFILLFMAKETKGHSK